jgi:hypothetical protein
MSQLSAEVQRLREQQEASQELSSAILEAQVCTHIPHNYSKDWNWEDSICFPPSPSPTPPPAPPPPPPPPTFAPHPANSFLAPSCILSPT